MGLSFAFVSACAGAAVWLVWRWRKGRSAGPARRLGVVVLGGGGLGAALRAELEVWGDRVVTSSRRGGIGPTGGEKNFPPCDVRDPASVRRALVAATAALGGRIDLVLCLAAVAQDATRPVRDSTVAELRDVVETNVLGALVVAREAAAILAPGAALVLCGGAGTVSQRPTPGYAAYAFSKGGLRQLAGSLAVEMAPVNVHVMVPGIAITPLLRVDTRTPDARWYFNVLGERPEVMARFFAPRLRALCDRPGGAALTLQYLTPVSVALRFATAWLRRNRLVDEQTGVVVPASVPRSVGQVLADWLVQ